MTEPLWSFEKLAWYARSEDPEVRYWATERLIRCFPERAPDVTALLILDEHDTTPELVADNLREFGRPEHVPLLLRAYRQMRGVVPGRAFEALIRIGAPEAIALARAAADRTDLSEESLALILEATAEEGGEEARAVVRDLIAKKPEILSEPGALAGALDSTDSAELPVLLTAFARALQWRGLGRCADLMRVISDHVEVDDCGWCIRTGPDGRIDLKKTLKAVEAGYDCELEGPLPAFTPETMRELAHAFRSGDWAVVIGALSSALQASAERLPHGPDDPLPERLSALAVASSNASLRAEAERLGPVFQQGIAIVLLSCLIKTARYRNYEREVGQAGTDVEALLSLAESETIFLLDLLPLSIARSVESASERGGGSRRERVLEWCRRILEARGPFFPRAVAIETIGMLRAEDHIPELLDALSDENSYVFTAAEKALGVIGGAVVGPARARLDARALDHEALHSLLILLVELGDRAALSLIIDHFDDFVERVGVGETAEWTALLGARELFDPLHGLLQRDVPRVGQALLLIGAIHNIPVAEEPQIQQAIDDYWRRHAQEEGAGGDEDGGSGSYVM